MPLGSGALAGVNWEIDRDAVAADLGFEHVTPQLDRRRLQPRLRPRLPGRRLDLRDAPLAASARRSSSGRAASSASASSTSPSPRAPDHAAEEEPRLGRAAAGQEPARRRLLPDPARGRCTRCRSPTARTCRRTRSRSSTRSTRSSPASTPPPGCSTGIEFDRERMEAASGDEMLAATEVADLLVRRGRALPRGARDRRRPRPRRGRARQVALRADPGGAAASAPSTSTTPTTRCCSGELAGVEADRRRHRLGAAGRRRSPRRGRRSAAVQARVDEERG